MPMEPVNTERDVSDRFTGGGMAVLLVVAGVVLFIIPEPSTSMLGLALILIGLGAWAVGWMQG